MSRKLKESRQEMRSQRLRDEGAVRFMRMEPQEGSVPAESISSWEQVGLLENSNVVRKKKKIPKSAAARFVN